MQQFDVAIIGGGLIGAGMARAIVGTGLRVAIIDHQLAADLYKPSMDNRGLALSYTSIKILEKLNIWPKLSAISYPIKTVHVSEQGAFGFTKLAANNFKIPALGYVVSASALGKALVQDLEILSDITVLRPMEIKSLCYDSVQSSWEIMLKEQKIKAKLLIAADGSDSCVRSRLNIDVSIKDYNQSAIVTNLMVNQAHKDIAYERFTKSGVLALLPFGDKKLKCVWTLNNCVVADFMRMTDAEFINTIQVIFGFRLGSFIRVDKRVVFPIRQMQANSLYVENAVLIGNAANTLHPVAAQGFNLGLRDVDTLAQVIVAGESLAKYAAQRSIDHQSTQKYSNNLVELFSSEAPLIKTARKIALLAGQFIPVLNRRIMVQGVGIWTS